MSDSSKLIILGLCYLVYITIGLLYAKSQTVEFQEQMSDSEDSRAGFLWITLCWPMIIAFRLLGMK